MDNSQPIRDSEFEEIERLAKDTKGNKGQLIRIAERGEACTDLVAKGVLRELTNPGNREAGAEVLLAIGKRSAGRLAIRIMGGLMSPDRRGVVMEVLETLGKGGSYAAIDIIFRGIGNPEQQKWCVQMLTSIGIEQPALVLRKLHEQLYDKRRAFPGREGLFAQLRRTIQENAAAGAQERELAQQAFGKKPDPPQGYVKINGIRRQAH